MDAPGTAVSSGISGNPVERGQNTGDDGVTGINTTKGCMMGVESGTVGEFTLI